MEYCCNPPTLLQYKLAQFCRWGTERYDWLPRRHADAGLTFKRGFVEDASHLPTRRRLGAFLQRRQ